MRRAAIPGGTPTDSASLVTALGSILAPVNDFRLTLESGVVVSTTDQTAKGTIYLCPNGMGNRIGLYTSGAWTVLQSAQVSLAVGTVVDATNYDIFAYYNSGVIGMEKVAWTNDTTRATALTTADGILVKTGDATRRYVGTIRTTSTTTTEDSDAKRFVWNQYNQTSRRMVCPSVTAGGGTWGYQTATWRPANSDSTNARVRYVTGSTETIVHARVAAMVQATGSAAGRVDIGVDSTSTNAAQQTCYLQPPSGSATSGAANYSGNPGVGYHELYWLEFGVSFGGSLTWFDTSGGISRLVAEIWN